MRKGKQVSQLGDVIHVNLLPPPWLMCFFPVSSLTSSTTFTFDVKAADRKKRSGREKVKDEGKKMRWGQKLRLRDGAGLCVLEVKPLFSSEWSEVSDVGNRKRATLRCDNALESGLATITAVPLLSLSLSLLYMCIVT